jgi:hypothetical protein
MKHSKKQAEKLKTRHFPSGGTLRILVGLGDILDEEEPEG